MLAGLLTQAAGVLGVVIGVAGSLTMAAAATAFLGGAVPMVTLCVGPAYGGRSARVGGSMSRGR